MPQEMKDVNLSGQEILNPKGQRCHLSLTMSSTRQQNNVECTCVCLEMRETKTVLHTDNVNFFKNGHVWAEVSV